MQSDAVITSENRCRNDATSVNCDKQNNRARKVKKNRRRMKRQSADVNSFGLVHTQSMVENASCSGHLASQRAPAGGMPLAKIEPPPLPIMASATKAAGLVENKACIVAPIS